MLEQPREDLGAVADVQVDVELRVAVAERADERRHDAGGPPDVTALMRSVARAPSAHSRAARPPSSSRPSTCAAYGANAAPARGPEPAAVALEELGAHLALERSDGRAHGRLRDEQLLGGRRHRAAAHD